MVISCGIPKTAGAGVMCMYAIYVQCQQCDSKYHTFLWARFNHFLNSRKFRPKFQSKRTKTNVHLIIASKK